MRTSVFLNSAFSLLLLMVLPLSANADACPQGMVTNPVGAGGQPQCVPGSNYQNWGGGSSTPSTPSAKWARRFGAVVYDPATGAVGISSEEKSKRKAFNAALAQCKAKGGTACTRNIEYYDQCVASATAPASSGFVFTSASAAKEDAASTYAMEDCRKAGGTECKIFYSGCSYPEQVQ